MTKKYILIILALSLLTRFAFFGRPAETVFDEVHFGKFVSGYFSGEYYFDIHPPLGKLIIASMLKVRAFLPRSEPKVLLPGSFETIGQDFSDGTYKWLRFLPKLAGTFLPVVIFLIALELGISQKFAFLAGLLLVFENSLLTQSRFILLDSFLLLFGFLGILFYLKFKNNPLKPGAELFLSGFFAILAGSVKWTGLSFLALIMIFYFINSNYNARALRLEFWLKGLIALIAFSFLIYFSIFAVHFSLLKNPGPGNAFHPPNFQGMNVFEKFVELNTEIYQSNARLTASHPYTSQWYEWPFMTRPIYYWNGPSSAEASEGTAARIYLLGNPLIYWLSAAAVILLLLRNFQSILPTPPKQLRLRRPGNFQINTKTFLLAGYFLNLLPFIFIGRVMFLYHYMTALIFAVLLLAYLLNKAEFKNKKIAFNAILAGSVILFLFFSPLTYGLEIPDWYYKSMVWFPGWK